MLKHMKTKDRGISSSTLSENLQAVKCMAVSAVSPPAASAALLVRAAVAPQAAPAQLSVASFAALLAPGSAVKGLATALLEARQAALAKSPWDMRRGSRNCTTGMVAQADLDDQAIGYLTMCSMSRSFAHR
jgi:hypothetical protein